MFQFLNRFRRKASNTSVTQPLEPWPKKEFGAIPDEPAIIETIIQFPDDDTPRLVFSDKLDDYEDPRGPFIRQQCWNAQKGYEYERSIQGRNLIPDKLFETNEEIWKKKLKPYNIINNHFYFHRGFPSELEIDATDFIKHGKALLEQAPLLHISIWNCNEHLKKLFQCEFLIKVPSLSFNGNERGEYITPNERRGGEELAKAIANCPHLRKLKSLYIGSENIKTEGALAIAHSPYLQNLRCLWLNHNYIGNEGLAAIASSDNLQDLVYLNVRYGNISGETLAELPRHRLKRLEELDIDGNDINEWQAQCFFDAHPKMRNISFGCEGNYGCINCEEVRWANIHMNSGSFHTRVARM